MTYLLIRVEAVEARETESPMNNKSRNLSETISRESSNLSTNLPEMIVEPSAGLFRGFC
jgi:hypothetical protein